MKLFVWTACIGTPERVSSLYEMIDSVKKVYPDAWFGVSMSKTDVSLQDRDNVILLKQNKKCTQFEHLEYLNDMFQTVDEDSHVLFMDDDDLLLTAPDIPIKDDTIISIYSNYKRCSTDTNSRGDEREYR